MSKDPDFDIKIAAGSSGLNYVKDLWRYRELFYMLSWRDVKVRYKQTAIGATWSVLRPVLTMAVFTVVFGRIAKLQTDGEAPYFLMVFAGLIPWQFFSYSLAEASMSLVGNSSLITKVYFPRIIIPASTVLTGLLDFAISITLMLVMMFLVGFIPSWKIVFVPLFTLLTLAISFGVSLYLTALNVKYRDFRYIIPFIVQFGLYLSPVGFSSSIVPEKWRLWFSLNPMVGVIEGFRWSILGEGELRMESLFMSVGFAAISLWLGSLYFRKTERSFADNI
jgi:lipopolysaccharide transport system permease protein